MKCRLCEQNKDLRNSHILPEFLYKPLYDSKNKMAGITGKGWRKWKFLKKGLSEKLLCGECEQFLNTNYEQPFNKFWFGRKVLPYHFDSNYITIQGIDYPSFKLFHMSILFRASVSKLPTFSLVKLGPHEEELRKMLKNKTPGPSHKYPIFACAVVDRSKTVIHGLITNPKEYRLEEHRSYGMVFGGCMWRYIVSSHRCDTILPCSLTDSGILTIIPWPLSKLDDIQDAAQALRQ